MSLRPRFLEAKSNLFCHFLTLRLLYLGRKSDSQEKGNLKIQNGSFGLPFFASTNELTPKKATLFSESAAFGCLFLLVRLVPPRKRQPFYSKTGFWLLFPVHDVFEAGKRQPFLQKAAKKVAFSQKYQCKPRFWEKGLYFSGLFCLRVPKNTNANGVLKKGLLFSRLFPFREPKNTNANGVFGKKVCFFPG